MDRIRFGIVGAVKMPEPANQGVPGDIFSAEGKFCCSMDEDETDHHVLKSENGDCTLRDDAADVIGFAIDVPAMSESGRQ